MTRIGFHGGTTNSWLREPKDFKKLDELRFTWQAWEKIISLRNAHPSTEVGFLLISKPEDKFTIIDIMVPRQEVSSVSVKFDPDHYNDIRTALHEAKLLPQLWEAWGHSHPGASASPSGTDLDTFSDSYAQSQMGLMFIIGKGEKAETNACFRWLDHTHKVYTEIQLKVVILDHPLEKMHTAVGLRELANFYDDVEKWLAEVNTWINERTYSTSYNSAPNHSIVASHHGTRWDENKKAWVPLDAKGNPSYCGGPANPSVGTGHTSQPGVTDSPQTYDPDAMDEEDWRTAYGAGPRQKARSLSQHAEFKALAKDMYDAAPNFDGKPRVGQEEHYGKWYDYLWNKYRALTHEEQGFVDDVLKDEHCCRVAEDGIWILEILGTLVL